MKSIRKFLGLPPAVGDTVKGALDFGVTYEGVVTETNYNPDFPYAKVEGRVFSHDGLLRQIVEEGEFIVIKSRLLIK